MAELFAQIAVSLDNFVEDADRKIDWMTEDNSSAGLHTATLESIDGMIFGRTAWEAIAAFWREAASQNHDDADMAAQARLMADLPKYVLTRSSAATAAHSNVHLVTLDDIPRISAEAKRPIAVFAGAGVIQALIARLSAINLIRYPVILGGGTPLFAEDSARRELKLQGTKPFESGAVLERYGFK